MARSTKASNAVLRLKERTQQAPYSMATTSDGFFYLLHDHDTKLCEPLEMDAFVVFVNNIQKAPAKKASKLDLAFEEKLHNSRKN